AVGRPRDAVAAEPPAQRRERAHAAAPRAQRGGLALPHRAGGAVLLRAQAPGPGGGRAAPLPRRGPRALPLGPARQARDAPRGDRRLVRGASLRRGHGLRLAAGLPRPAGPGSLAPRTACLVPRGRAGGGAFVLDSFGCPHGRLWLGIDV